MQKKLAYEEGREGKEKQGKEAGVVSGRQEEEQGERAFL